MAQVQRRFTVPAGRVWDVWANGWAYDKWVLGTKKIRDVDAGWPRKGTRIHFSAGVGPITYDDETHVLACDPGLHLELEARAFPVGSARIDLRVEAQGNDACLVTIDEHPLRGPAATLHNAIFDIGIKLRLGKMLRNLESLVRQEQAGG